MADQKYRLVLEVTKDQIPKERDMPREGSFSQEGTSSTHQSEPAPTSSTTTKSKSLNPVAKPFIPNALDQLYTKHAAALNRQRAIKIQMDTFQDMSMTAEESGYDHERLGEMSRDLAFRFMDAVDDTAGLEREIEGLFGREALIGRNTHLNDEK